jgi:hypothetical protein
MIFTVTGIGAMQMERNKQIDRGYTVEHDRVHGDDLLRAAACYLDWAACQKELIDVDIPHPFWPWAEEEWNPGTPDEALVKAGAMVAAYYDANLATEENPAGVEEV